MPTLNTGTNAFLRPTGGNAFEVLDPSVIDLVNAVVRRAPENAVDLVVGAVDFSQIERVWNISEGGVQGIRAALIQGGGSIAAAIKSALARSHRLVKLQDGAALREWTEEARFAAIVPLADAMKTKEMLDLAKSLGADMSSSWRDREISIIDGVDALRALARVSWESLQSPTLEHELIEQLLKQAQVSCRSVELSEIVSVLDLEEPRNAANLAALQEAFENSRHEIGSDIDECRKEDDFKGLRDDYELFASALGVDVSLELEKLEEAYSEYSDYEEQRADQMMDEYIDRQRESAIPRTTSATCLVRSEATGQTRFSTRMAYHKGRRETVLRSIHPSHKRQRRLTLLCVALHTQRHARQRIQLRVPVEIVQLAVEQVIRREQPGVAIGLARMPCMRS